MPRANRHYIPGHVWHLTHRYHKKEFLLKFGRDRRLWIKWLFESKKRYGLSILNYMVTSNHIHLMVTDNGKRDTIPKSLQLMAGRTGQEYNQRKKRKGAFWEDRYHASAIGFDEHLNKCMLYLDMNMVLAGVVDHPEEWPFCGYNEIQNPRQRYSLIDCPRVISLFQMKDLDELQESCRNRVEQSLLSKDQSRDIKWTESIAVGSNKSYELREPAVPYGGNFTHKNGRLKHQNTYFWNDII